MMFRLPLSDASGRDERTRSVRLSGARLDGSAIRYRSATALQRHASALTLPQASHERCIAERSELASQPRSYNRGSVARPCTMIPRPAGSQTAKAEPRVTSRDERADQLANREFRSFRSRRGSGASQRAQRLPLARQLESRRRPLRWADRTSDLASLERSAARLRPLSRAVPHGRRARACSTSAAAVGPSRRALLSRQPERTGWGLQWPSLSA